MKLFHSRLETLSLLALLVVSGACTGVLNDPAIQAGSSGISINDDNPNNLKWNALETIYGNKQSITITGGCGPDITQVVVQSSPLHSGATVASYSFSVPCSNGAWSAPFTATGRTFTENGQYQLTFAGQIGSSSEYSSISKTYNILYDANPENMLQLVCQVQTNNNGTPRTGVTGVTISNAVTTCTGHDANDPTPGDLIENSATLTSTCTASVASRNPTITVNGSNQSSCGFTYLWTNKTQGGYLAQVTWSDKWGNGYSRNVTFLQEGIVSVIGSVSWIPSGSFDGGSGVVIRQAVGTPFASSASYTAGDSAGVNYLLQLSGTTAYGSPGYMSLIYGFPTESVP